MSAVSSVDCERPVPHLPTLALPVHICTVTRVLPLRALLGGPLSAFRALYSKPTTLRLSGLAAIIAGPSSKILGETATAGGFLNECR